MTSIRARMGTLEVGDEHLRSNRNGGGRWRAFGLEWIRLGWETSICARINMVEADDEHSGSN